MGRRVGQHPPGQDLLASSPPRSSTERRGQAGRLRPGVQATILLAPLLPPLWSGGLWAWAGCLRLPEPVFSSEQQGERSPSAVVVKMGWGVGFELQHIVGAQSTRQVPPPHLPPWHDSRVTPQAALCARRGCMEAIVAQLASESEELHQVPGGLWCCRGWGATLGSATCRRGACGWAL